MAYRSLLLDEMQVSINVNYCQSLSIYYIERLLRKARARKYPPFSTIEQVYHVLFSGGG